jgi:hypothetical protein
MLTNPATYTAPPVAIPPASAPVVKGNGTKLPAIHATPSPRKTLTDSDRRRMCQYHEENPSVKQTEIGGEKIKSGILGPVVNSYTAMFGVERRYFYIQLVFPHLLRSYFQHCFQSPPSAGEVSLSRRP